MHYVYILKSKNHPHQIYIGQTKCVEDRLSTHNNGGSTHTAKYKPWDLVCFISFLEPSKALQFEAYLKSGSGRAFLKKRFL